ncbi:hypothetical protein LTR10_010209 [Elasticomyces elasticus]|nr:hypothetical protein LTR10_010209 [Elasticomyces elasticus]KAK4972113.1 hypothetical protein LTR42_006619 [Elasticomyces elasticus]
MTDTYRPSSLASRDAAQAAASSDRARSSRPPLLGEQPSWNQWRRPGPAGPAPFGAANGMPSYVTSGAEYYERYQTASTVDGYTDAGAPMDLPMLGSNMRSSIPLARDQRSPFDTGIDRTISRDETRGENARECMWMQTLAARSSRASTGVLSKRGHRPDHRTQMHKTQNSAEADFTIDDNNNAIVLRASASDLALRGVTSEPSESDGQTSAARTNELKWSGDEEKEMPRRPPALSQANSYPAGLKIPTIDRRAERELLRSNGNIQTPFMPNPNPNPNPSLSSQHNKYRHLQELTDDLEYPTPDGYRVEPRQSRPGGARTTRPGYTKSPARMGSESERDRPHRAASARYEEDLPHYPLVQPSRTTSTSYAYTPGQYEDDVPYGRPTMNRETLPSFGISSGYDMERTNSTMAKDTADLKAIREFRGREQQTRNPRLSSSRYPSTSSEDV